MPSRSTSTCPASTAGTCSIASSTTLSTRHIPVHVISVTDDPHRGMRLGAKTFWAKPSERDTLDEAFAAISEFNDRKLRTLLIVEDDDVQRGTLVELIGDQRRRNHRRRHRQRSARRNWPPSRSTASCSTSGCTT